MKFETTGLADAFVIEMQAFQDNRGFFADTYSRSKMEQHGIIGDIIQSSFSFNLKKGTLRGMHFQVEPKAQPKLVRCTTGAVYDVIVDLRPQSATFRKWFGTQLSAENHRSIYIPKGFAHGFITLSDNTEFLYDMFESYAPQTARGVRYNDPAFRIKWPIEVSVISERDATYPDFEK